ncbi:MAG: diguanylate cyclase domain-containing protein, partial [bacterium]
MKFVAVNIDISNEKSKLNTLKYEALHDNLTELPNRAIYRDRLAVACRKQRRHTDYRFAVLFLDLDNFKQVNDQYGHQIGDQLLLDISERFQQVLRPEDTIARYGGDEFIFLIDRFNDPDQLENIANRILETLDN